MLPVDEFGRLRSGASESGQADIQVKDLGSVNGPHASCIALCRAF